MTAIAFTASRDGFAPPPDLVPSLLFQLLEPDQCITGGCQGGDAWLGRWLSYHWLMAEHVIVVPADRSRVDPWWETVRARRITLVEMPPGTSYRDRNAELVRRGDQVLGFPAYPEDNPRSVRSGTWQTLRLGRKTGKPVQWQCVLPPYQGG